MSVRNPEIPRVIAPFIEKSQSANLNFSKLSAASTHEIQNARKSKTHGPDGSESYNNFVHATFRRLIDSYIVAEEAQFDFASRVLKHMVKDHHAGKVLVKFNIKESEYRGELRRLETEVGRSAAIIASAKVSKYAAIGSLTDAALQMQKLPIHDYAYIDLHMSRYRSPPNARFTLFESRDKGEQGRFTNDLFKAHDARKCQIAESAIWCVVSGRYVELGQMKAAHSVACNAGEASAVHVFGGTKEEDGHIMGLRNGLPMRKRYEELFDQSRIAFVPVGDSTKMRLKVVVLDETLLKEKGDDIDVRPWGAEVQDLELCFRNEFRPSFRYLYFAYIINVLRRQRHQAAGWWKDYFVHKDQKTWASPGEYMRLSALTKLAREIGHIADHKSTTIRDEFEELEDDHEMLPDAKDDVLAKTVVVSNKPAEEDHEEDEEDDSAAEDARVFEPQYNCW